MGRATKPAKAAALRLALVMVLGAGLAGCSGVSSSLQNLNPFSSSGDMTLADGPVSLRQLREAGGERLSEDTIRSSLSGQEFVWQPIGLDASGVIAFKANGGLEGSIVSKDGVLTEVQAGWTVERGQRCTVLDGSTVCFELWRRGAILYEFDAQGRHRATYRPSQK
jgi:hypothetical protein